MRVLNNKLIGIGITTCCQTGQLATLISAANQSHNLIQLIN